MSNAVTQAATATARQSSPAGRNLLRTTSFQLTASYFLLTGLLLSILLGVIYWSSFGYLRSQTDETIAAEIAGLEEHLRTTGPNGLARVLQERIRQDPAGRNRYLLIGTRPRINITNLKARPENLEETPDGWVEFREDNAVVRARYFTVVGDVIMLVGRDVRELAEMTRLFWRALAIGLVLTLALSLIGGLALSALLLRRVDSITRTARQIMDGDLSQRMPLRGSGDELDQLAEHLNNMLSRIETLMGSARHVSDNIAHDLRTPLTRLRTRLETLHNSTDDVDTLRAGLEGCIEESDQLLATFQALLRIARLESRSLATRSEPLLLATLATDACELYRAVADEAHLTLSVHINDEERDDHATDADDSNQSLIDGDRDLLFQMIVNLLDNAIKYTPPGGRIDVAVHRHDGEVELRVADNGPGIPAEQRPRAFDLFFRVDGARSAPGNGLGLALVKAVADHHGARLTLDDANPGLIVLVRFTPAG